MGERMGNKQQTYATDKKPKTHFNDVSEGKMWATLLGDEVKAKNTWRICFLVATLCNIVSLFFIFYAINLPRTVPLVIEVNEFGEAKYIGKIDKLNYSTFKPKDYIIQSHIEQFISATREVGLDPQVLNKNLHKSFYYISSVLTQKLNEDINVRRPFNLVGKVRINVEFESTIRVTDRTWQADWTDVYTAISGVEVDRKRYRGIFTIDDQEPKDEAERHMNPLGIWITDFSIQELAKVKETQGD